MECYLAEWFRAELWQRESFSDNFRQLCRGARLSGDGGESATVLITVSVPTDDAIFCVFTASSAEAVATACDAAGLPPQRVTAAVAMDINDEAPRA
ncbi:hypothetical protein [Mycolicibacterium sp. 120270]|uniref:hypothetical protein n=1 Tax=Mycolicibacterium sp. 120270 TaxID=3090600 RepID=UPI00299E215D|nr:hypothetical protein [Mycolicibacterium sp. 120270]MDX1882318.1 hypothetical protein [Mycolicibacterium sp. 120270]